MGEGKERMRVWEGAEVIVGRSGVYRIVGVG